MIPLSLTAPPSASLALKPCYLPSLKPTSTIYNQLNKLNQSRRRSRNGKCRAEFSADAPVAAAIGACILNSLIFPLPPPPEDMEAESLIDSADARFAVMGIISFIPYFNWMSWVFAWLDTSRQRYAIYAIVYFAPYLRSNFSISPEESWLPITSIILCIIHIQLEASMKNGDIQGFQLLDEAAKRLSSITRKEKTGRNEEVKGRKMDFHNLPSVREKERRELHDQNAPQEPNQGHEISNDDEEANGGSKH